VNLLRVILFAVFFRRFAAQNPEAVDGKAALVAIMAAFEQDGYL
jgi:hypothetical protein